MSTGSGDSASNVDERVSTAAAVLLLEQAHGIGWRTSVSLALVRHQNRYHASISRIVGDRADGVDLWWKISYPSRTLRFDCATRATAVGLERTQTKNTAIDWMNA